MIVYHAAKSIEAVNNILQEMLIRVGRNVASRKKFAHVSLEPFQPGSFTLLDVIGPDTNEAWILKLEIPDDIYLKDDPANEGGAYGNGWKVSERPIPVLAILTITHVPNVAEWEWSGFTGPVVRDCGNLAT